jgi:hypothetical protein
MNKVNKNIIVQQIPLNENGHPMISDEIIDRSHKAIKNALGDNNGGCFDLSKAGELGYVNAYNVIKDYCN